MCTLLFEFFGHHYCVKRRSDGFILSRFDTERQRSTGETLTTFASQDGEDLATLAIAALIGSLQPLEVGTEVYVSELRGVVTEVLEHNAYVVRLDSGRTKRYPRMRLSDAERTPRT